MTALRDAAEQALEALENHTAIKHPQQRHYRDSAIDALRAALETKSTHSTECYKWHHECAVAEIRRLRAALAEQQAPVAWAGCGECDCSFPCHKGEGRCLRLPPRKPLAEPVQEPLTNEQLRAVIIANWRHGVWAVARGIERAHGIKE